MSFRTELNSIWIKKPMQCFTLTWFGLSLQFCTWVRLRTFSKPINLLPVSESWAPIWQETQFIVLFKWALNETKNYWEVGQRCFSLSSRPETDFKVVSSDSPSSSINRKWYSPSKCYERPESGIDEAKIKHNVPSALMLVNIQLYRRHLEFLSLNGFISLLSRIFRETTKLTEMGCE